MLVNTNKYPTKQAGFTITELVISVTVLGIIIVGIFSAITYFFVNMTKNNLFAEMTTDSQNLLRASVEELRYGAGVRITNTITDPNAPSGGWNTSNEAFVIIIAVPAVDSDDNYIIDTQTGAPYNNELVYFKDGDVLYKRTLAHPNATGNTLLTSCPEASATSTCPADRELARYVDDMVFTLYDQDNNPTSNPLLARSVKIALSMSRETFGSPLELENNIQVTLRNRFQ